MASIRIEGFRDGRWETAYTQEIVGNEAQIPAHEWTKACSEYREVRWGVDGFIGMLQISISEIDTAAPSPDNAPNWRRIPNG